MEQVVYVVTYLAVAVALCGTVAVIMLPCLAFVTVFYRYDVAVISFDSLLKIMRAERYDGQPGPKDQQALMNQSKLIDTLQKDLDSGEAVELVQARDDALLGLLLEPGDNRWVAESFLLRSRRLRYQTISINRFAGRMDASRGVWRTRINRNRWYAMELTYLIGKAARHYVKVVGSRVTTKATDYLGRWSVFAVLGAFIIWFFDNSSAVIDDAAWTLAIGGVAAYDYLCIHEFVTIARQTRGNIPAKPHSPLRRRDKVFLALLPIVLVYGILEVRYHYSEQLFSWIKRLVIRQHWHVHMHVSPTLVGTLVFGAVSGASIYVAGRNIRRSLRRDLNLPRRLYDVGVACLALAFGLLFGQVAIYTAVYGIGDQHPFPSWQAYIVEFMSLAGIAFLGAGRLADMIDKRRVYRLAVGRAQPWQVRIWLAIVLTWVGATVAMYIAGVALYLQRRSRLKPGQYEPPPPAWFAVAILGITAVAIVTTVALVVIRKRRLGEFTRELGEVRRCAENVAAAG